MSTWGHSPPQFTFPRPGKALRGVLITLFVLWLMFAIAINWGDASIELFYLFCGNTEAILAGEVWRLFTAALMHYPQGNLGHILWTMLGLYFLTPSLEDQWGSGRLLRFLFGSAVITYAFQMGVALLLPASTSAKLVGPYWFGAFPVVESVAIAWALSFRGQQVRLMFVLPVTSRGLVGFVVGISILRVIALSGAPEGLISPFGGMLSGWLLGGGTPSPARRLYLKLKLARLEREAQRANRQRKERVQKHRFSVIEGGKSETRKKDRDPDGGWLN